MMVALRTSRCGRYLIAMALVLAGTVSVLPAPGQARGGGAGDLLPLRDLPEQPFDVVTRERGTERLQHLERVRQAQEGTVRSLQAALEEYRRNNEVPAVMALHSAELAMLQEMTSDLVKARGDMQAAQALLDNLKSQDMDAIKLSSDMQEWVERSAEMTNLVNTRHALEQDMAGAVAGRKEKAVLDGIQARLDKVGEQISGARRDLQKQARAMMLDAGERDCRSSTARFQALAKQTTDQETRLKELDMALGSYQHRADEARVQEDLLLKIEQEYRAAQLQDIESGTQSLKVYDVRDLLGVATAQTGPLTADQRGAAEELVATVNNHAGPGMKVSTFNGSLVVTATATAHRQVAALLEALRDRPRERAATRNAGR